jgi:hypothetical protein
MGFYIAAILFCIVGLISALSGGSIAPWIPIGMMFTVLGTTTGRR